MTRARVSHEFEVPGCVPGVDTRVRLRVDDEGRGTPVVLLHGFTGDASTMGDIADRLVHTHRVITPDLIGHGRSTMVSARAGDVGSIDRRAEYSVEAMAAQIVAMLDHLDDQRRDAGPRPPVDVVGYSMGGRIALALACTFPDRIRTVTVIGASAGLETPAEREQRVEADDALARALETDGLEAFVDRWMANPLFSTQARLGPERLGRFRDQRLRNDATELARSLRAAGTGSMCPLHAELGTCFVPVRLVVGDADAKFATIAEDLVARVPNADMVVIDDAGHAAHLEQPDAVVDALALQSPFSPRSARPTSPQIRSAPDRVARKPRNAATQATLHPIELPVRTAIETSRTTVQVRSVLLLRLASGDGDGDDDGLGGEGWGEVSVMPGWSIETLGACHQALEQVLPRLTDALDGIARGSDLWDAVAVVLADLEPLPAARAAVAGAVLDLEARRRGIALHEHLVERFWTPTPSDTAPRRPTTPQEAVAIEVQALIAVPDEDAVRQAVADAVSTGYRTVKLKVGVGSPQHDIARVAAARAADDRVEIRLDANGGWDEKTAAHVLKAMASHGVALCEEPVSGLDALARFAATSPVPVAADESVRTPAELDRVCAIGPAGGIMAIVIKPQALGGADRALAAIRRVHDAGLTTIITSMIDSAVGVAHAAHVAVASGQPGPHGLATAGLLLRNVAHPAALPVRHGRLHTAAADDPQRWGPGIGLGTISPAPVHPS